MYELLMAAGPAGNAIAPPPAKPVPAKPMPARPVPPAALPAPARSGSFGDLATEYGAYFAACESRPEHAATIEHCVTRLIRFKPLYCGVSVAMGPLPWQVVGIIHALESSFDFSRHLHNGDPLTERTRRVPQGRPYTGSPPYTWRASAIDALTMKGLHRVPAWPVARVLFELERYNGFGYRRRGLASPYLWSFTNIYSKGKYVRDGAFDPEAVSKQCGAAAILRGLEAKGLGLAG